MDPKVTAENRYSSTTTTVTDVAANHSALMEATAEKYYPLALQYTRDDGSVKWSLLFQEKPRLRIVRKGEMPTTEELVKVLSYLPFPAMMVPLLHICAAQADVDEG